MYFSLSQQTVYFLASIAFGAVLAALYDPVRALRMLLRARRAMTLLTDILFFFLCGVLTSLFALPFNRGEVRAFILFGEAAGFLLYRLTLGSVFGRIYAGIARLLRCFFRKFCEKLKKFFDYLLKAAALLVYNTGVVIDRIRRTALSGVRVLIRERRAAHDRRHQNVTLASPEERRDPIKGSQHGKKNTNTRKKRRKARGKSQDPAGEHQARRG